MWLCLYNFIFFFLEDLQIVQALVPSEHFLLSWRNLTQTCSEMIPRLFPGSMIETTLGLLWKRAWILFHLSLP